MEARDLFDKLAAEDLAAPEVSIGRVFRSDGLRVNDKIYAMLVVDRLVVKVPADTVAAMLASGEGEPFTSGGRVMREWVTVRGVDAKAWRPLMAEARAFVAAGSKAKPRKRG
jgi:TfoX/Sxy family transcriptional regulator of competence genes